MQPAPIRREIICARSPNTPQKLPPLTSDLRAKLLSVTLEVTNALIPLVVLRTVLIPRLTQRRKLAPNRARLRTSETAGAEILSVVTSALEARSRPPMGTNSRLRPSSVAL